MLGTVPQKDLAVNNFACPNISTGRLIAHQIILDGKTLKPSKRGRTGPRGEPGVPLLSYGTATTGGTQAPSETKGGTDALSLNTGTLSFSNTAFGRSSLAALPDSTICSGNTAVGYFAGAAFTDADQNVVIGNGALNDSKAASVNVAIGSGAMSNNPDPGSIVQDCVSIGYHSMIGSFDCGGLVVIGSNAGSGGLNIDSLVAIGQQACLAVTTSPANVALGNGALQTLTNNATGMNTALGYLTLPFATASENTAVGANSGRGITTGTNNTCLGSGTGQGISSGSGNILLGRNADVSAAVSDTIVIGAGISSALSHHTEIGTGTTTTCAIQGIFGVTVDAGSGTAVNIDSSGKLGTVISSRRYKENIEDLDEKVIQQVLAFRPVKFNYKTGEKQICYGLIAEEVEEVNKDFVVYGKADDLGFKQVESVSYHLLPPVILRIVQDQHAKILDLTERLERLESSHKVLKV